MALIVVAVKSRVPLSIWYRSEEHTSELQSQSNLVCRLLLGKKRAHTYRRLCHVGDRTGLEMIRSLQDRVVQLGIEVHMAMTMKRLLKDGDLVVGPFA